MSEKHQDTADIVRTLKNPDRIRGAIFHLRMARELLIAAKAAKVELRVRAAMKSADGALRHAERVEHGRVSGHPVSRGKHALRIKDSRPEADPDT